MYAVLYDAVADVLETSNYVVGFDISVATYDSVSLDVSAQENYPESIAFNTDGTKMFIAGGNGDDIGEYALTTGFDVSTASFTDLFNSQPQDTKPEDVVFNTDGTLMFIVGDENDNVYQYTLTTGFDVSTASYSVSFSIASQETDPSGLTFSPDATMM